MTVPKKLEKFNNFIGNSFKIKDESVSLSVAFPICYISFISLDQKTAVGICPEESTKTMNQIKNFIIINIDHNFEGGLWSPNRLAYFIPLFFVTVITWPTLEVSVINSRQPLATSSGL